MLIILSSRKISHFLFTIFLFLSQIIYSQNVVEDSCKSITSYTNTQCFNEKIIFYDTFRGGNFETLDDGTLIIEYSSNNENLKRMFYGLKKMVAIIFPMKHQLKYSMRRIQKMRIMADINQKIKLYIWQKTKKKRSNIYSVLVYIKPPLNYMIFKVVIQHIGTL